MSIRKRHRSDKSTTLIIICFKTKAWIRKQTKIQIYDIDYYLCLSSRKKPLFILTLSLYTHQGAHHHSMSADRGRFRPVQSAAGGGTESIA